MDWASHVKAFQAQWIIRYAADPAASSWKNLLDSFLLEDDDSNVKFTEGRAIFFCKLNNANKAALLRDIPGPAYVSRAIQLDLSGYAPDTASSGRSHPKPAYVGKSVSHCGPERRTVAANTGQHESALDRCGDELGEAHRVSL